MIRANLETIVFEEKDVGKLKWRKLFVLILMVHLCVFALAIMAFAVWYYYVEHDEVVAQIAGLGSLFASFLVYKTHKKWMNIRRDLAKGLKEIVTGVITGKNAHKNYRELTINDVAYNVGHSHYHKYKKRQAVMIAYAPLSKIILDIEEL